MAELGNVAQVIRYLSWGFTATAVPEVWWHSPRIWPLKRQRQENEKFKIIFGYIANLWPAWATDPISKNKNQKRYTCHKEKLNYDIFRKCT